MIADAESAAILSGAVGAGKYLIVSAIEYGIYGFVVESLTLHTTFATDDSVARIHKIRKHFWFVLAAISFFAVMTVWAMPSLGRNATEGFVMVFLLILGPVLLAVRNVARRTSSDRQSE